ncbi:MAG: DUF924 family protein [Pseudomonadota bacterium]
MPASPAPASARLRAVVEFWRAAGPKRWFRKNAAFDRDFHDRFMEQHQAAAQGEYDAAAAASPESALAVLLLLDQFPRNTFRGSARAFATDGQALDLAARAVARGDDRQVEPALQAFFYLPFMHSEALANQQRSVELNRRLGGGSLRAAEVHQDIIERFGRFPHRNTVLGRPTTAAEQAFLDAGGFKG